MEAESHPWLVSPQIYAKMCEHPQHPRADFPLSCEQRSSRVNHSKTTINTFLVFLMLVCVHQRTGFTQPHYWSLKRDTRPHRMALRPAGHFDGDERASEGGLSNFTPPLAFCPSFYFTLVYRNQNSSAPMQAVKPGKVTLETCPFSIECLQVTGHLLHT